MSVATSTGSSRNSTSTRRQNGDANSSANSSVGRTGADSSAAEEANSLADDLFLANEYDGDEGDEVLALAARRGRREEKEVPMENSPTKGRFNARRVAMGEVLVRTMQESTNPGLRENKVVLSNGRNVTVEVPRVRKLKL